MSITTIAVSKKTKKELKKLKIHLRQSYDEVIRELIKKRIFHGRRKVS